jgi:hypothetical protein
LQRLREKIEQGFVCPAFDSGGGNRNLHAPAMNPDHRGYLGPRARMQMQQRVGSGLSRPFESICRNVRARIGALSRFRRLAIAPAFE